MSTDPATLDLLTALAESTRLRIINCLAGAPLFVSELQDILDIPQPTVSRHLRVLRDAGLVRDTPISQFVLYRLRRPADPQGRVLNAVLEAARKDRGLGSERANAAARSRTPARSRLVLDSEESHA